MRQEKVIIISEGGRETARIAIEAEGEVSLLGGQPTDRGCDGTEVRECENTSAAPTAHRTLAPTETQEDPGKVIYRVGLLSDIHFDADDAKGSLFATDLKAALDCFIDEGVEFIGCTGDLCEYDVRDLPLFYDWYNAHGWARTRGSLRLLTAIGNHDYMQLSAWRELNGFRTFGGTVFDLPAGAEYEDQRVGVQKGYFARFSGEDEYHDLNFFEYGGRWDRQKAGRRTNKSKLSYWTERHGDIYVFLSLDYGTEAPQLRGTWGVLSRAVNLLDASDPEVRQLEEYVADTPYDRSREALFNYQFYHPGTLLWLKDILENNRDRRVFVFTHHFLPHKAGNQGSDPAADYYSKLRLWPYTASVAMQKRYWTGSNTLCGLEFHVLNKLNNEHPNAVWFSGHTHYQWGDDCNNFCRSDYPVRLPDGTERTPEAESNASLAERGLYLRTSATPTRRCAANVHLPSLAKPTTNADGSTLYGAAEGGIMEVCERGVAIRRLRFRRDGAQAYQREDLGRVIINME